MTRGKPTPKSEIFPMTTGTIISKVWSFFVMRCQQQEGAAALKRSAALRQSILKKAFTGQLVPQDPTDEPASALLERIREEREVTAKTPKRNIKA